MATTIVTGRKLALTVNSKGYDAQCSMAVLKYQNVIQTYQTLDGPKSIVTGTEGTLEVDMFIDFGETSGLMDDLWTAAGTGTAVAFTLVVDATTDKTFTGFVIPQFPEVGGAANDALTTKITFVIDGTVSKA